MYWCNIGWLHNHSIKHGKHQIPLHDAIQKVKVDTKSVQLIQSVLLMSILAASLSRIYIAGCTVTFTRRPNQKRGGRSEITSAAQVPSRAELQCHPQHAKQQRQARDGHLIGKSSRRIFLKIVGASFQLNFRILAGASSTALRSTTTFIQGACSPHRLRNVRHRSSLA